MGKIRELPQDLINKIAAGEVVERPASVVKELVENAIDAGATRVEIVVKEGGLKLVEVIDNGSGMVEEDLRLAIQPHATSKIANLDDLAKISSFGFRGEALSAISAVSDFELASRTSDSDLGRCLRLVSGEVLIDLAGMEVGTRVSVANLFHNVPARRKFMKAPATEFGHLADTVSAIALAFPAVTFTLTHNGKEYFHLIPASVLERVQEVIGADRGDRLIQVQREEPHLSISGYVSRPEINTLRPEKQFIFVNQRRISNSLLSAAVKKAYGTTLMPRSFPLFALFISLPEEMVDVNVHPRKAEVAFVNSGAVYNAILEAVATALGSVDLTYGREFSLPSRAGTASWSKTRPMMSRSLGEGMKSASLWNQGDYSSFQERTLLAFETEVKEILQIHNTYLVTMSAQGLMIVDQHAAHERVLYEKFLQSFSAQKETPPTQRLLAPITLKLSLKQKGIFKDQKEVLERVGFLIEGDAVVGIPLLVKQQDLVALLSEFLGDLENDDILREIDDQSLRALTFLSCRSAVKAGDSLSLPERRALLADLENCRSPYTCPHGRPVTIDLSLKELEKMFKRVL